MSVLMVPKVDRVKWPTLGPQIVHWYETFLVYGPGDVRGQPYKVDVEKRGVTYRLYEINPPGAVTPEGRLVEGRRRFKRGAISVRKGWAKTEHGAAITAGELHPSAPVRFDHWAEEGEVSSWGYVYSQGEPVGRGVKDPYIPMVAYTLDQAEELAFFALTVMLEEGPLARDFDISKERIIVLGETGKAAGKAVALASSPNARDGARTSFQFFDETHRMELERLVKAHQTMQANIPKRWMADAWTLETTTSYEPGLGSVAEATMEYARKVDQGKVKDSRMFFFHRQASDEHDLTTTAGKRAAVLEATGPAAGEWTDIDGIVELGNDPQTDPTYWERVWLNRPTQGGGAAFPLARWDELSIRESEDTSSLWKPEKKSIITLGFDGSETNDSTALVGTDLITGTQFLVGIWENDGTPRWRVDVDSVNQVVEEAFKRWRVYKMYADPYFWELEVSAWIAKHKFRGRQAVFPWHTNVHKRMAYSLQAYIHAMRTGELKQNGDPKLREHIGNSKRKYIRMEDEQGNCLFILRKDRDDSPFKIDAAMAGNLSWEAFRDGEADGMRRRRSRKLIS